MRHAMSCPGVERPSDPAMVRAAIARMAQIDKVQEPRDRFHLALLA
jgi:hypothetical protein